MSARFAHILVGPTASGKTAVARHLALQHHPPTLLISADSMAIYRHMDIGTAKSSEAELLATPTLGINLADPSDTFSAGDYLAAIRAQRHLLDAQPPTQLPIVVGGTGLYIKALLGGLDAPPSNPIHRAKAEAIWADQGLQALQAATRALNPKQYDRLCDPENPRRVIRAFELLSEGHPLPPAPARLAAPIVGLRVSSKCLRERIARRTRQMFANGLIEELAEIRRTHPTLSHTAQHAIGYEEAGQVLNGTCSVEDAIQQTIQRTTRYAKRQMTWFRHQANVTWVDVQPSSDTAALAELVAEHWHRLGAAILQLG